MDLGGDGYRAEFQVDQITVDCESRRESTTHMAIARLLTWSQQCASFVAERAQDGGRSTGIHE